MDLRYNNIVVKFFLILLCIFNVIHTSNGLSNLKSMYMHNFEKAKEYSCAVNSLKWNMPPQYGFFAHSRTEFEKEKRSHLYSYFKNKQWFGDGNRHNKIEVESEHPVITILEGMREQTRNKLGNLLSHKENLQCEVLGLNPINFSSHLCGMKHSNGCGYSGDTLLQKVEEFIKEEGSLLKKDIKKPNLQEHEESCYGKICELTKEIIVSEKERDGDLYALCDTLFEKIEKEKVSDRPEIPQSRIGNYNFYVPESHYINANIEKQLGEKYADLLNFIKEKKLATLCYNVSSNMFLPQVKRSHRNINFTVDQDNESSPEVSLAVPLKTISFKNTKPEIIQAIEKAFYDELFLLEGESCLRGELRDKIEEVEAVARENIGIEADESSEEYEDECALVEEEWNLSVSGLVEASTLPLLLSFSHIPLEFQESSYPITRKEYDEIEAYKKIYDCKQTSTMSCCEVEEKIKAILKQEFPWVISPDFMDDCGLSMYELLPSRYMPFLNSENNFIPVTEEKYELDMKKKLQYMIECYQERIKYKEDSESLEERKEKCKKWFCDEFESNISCMENQERKLNACSKEDNMMMLEFEKFACHQNFCHENVSREKRCLTMMLYNNLIAMRAFIDAIIDEKSMKQSVSESDLLELQNKLEQCILLVKDKILLQLVPLYAWYDKESEVYKIVHSRLLNLRACIEGKGEPEVDEKCKLHVIDEEKLKKEQEKYCNGFYIAENAKGKDVSFYKFDEFKAKIRSEEKFKESSDKKQHSFVNKIRESFKECLKNEPDYLSRVAQQPTTQFVFANWFPWYEAQGEGSECIRKNKEIIENDNQIALIHKLHVALGHQKENSVEDMEKMNNNELVTLLSLSMCQSEVCQERIFSEHGRKMAMHCCESARREEEWRLVKQTKQIVDKMIAKIDEGDIQDEKKDIFKLYLKKELSDYLKNFAENNYFRVWSTRNNFECEIKKYANTLKYLEGKDDVALKFDYYDDFLVKKTYEFKVDGKQSEDDLRALLKDIKSSIPQKYWYLISYAFRDAFGICFSKPYLTDLFNIVQKVLGSENMNFYEDQIEKILSEAKEINDEYEKLQKSVYIDFIEKYEELYVKDNRYAENEEKFGRYYRLLQTFFAELPNTKEYTIFKKSCLNSLLKTYKWFGLDYVKEEDHQNDILKLIEKIWNNMKTKKDYSQTVLFFAWIYHCWDGYEKMALNKLYLKEIGGKEEELENAFRQFWCLNNEVLFKKLHYEKEKKYLEKIELPCLEDITDCLSGCLKRLKKYSSFKDCAFPEIDMSQISSSYWEESKNVIQFAKKLVKYEISVTGIELKNYEENLSENLDKKPADMELQSPQPKHSKHSGEISVTGIELENCEENLSDLDKKLADMELQSHHEKPAAVVLQSPQPEHSAWMTKFIKAIKIIMKIAGVGGLLCGSVYLLHELWLKTMATSG